MADDLSTHGELLRLHLFDGELLTLPTPETGMEGFLPPGFAGPLPALVFPPLAEQGFTPGENVNLEITPYHLYYGALRELAEVAEQARAEQLRAAVLHWNPDAALEVSEIAQYFVEDDLEIALLHFELALEVDEEFYEAAQNAGTCELALAAADPETCEERLENAEGYFRMAIDLRPDSGLSWANLAQVIHQRGEVDEANELLIEFLETYPEGEHRELVQQMLAGTLGGSDEGRPSAEEVAAFDEARVLAWGENPGRAVELLTPLAATHPDEPQIWFLLGAAYRRAGDLAEAERCLRRTVVRASDDPFAWSELAETYLEEGRWKEAGDATRRALELDGENPMYALQRARSLEGLGEYEEALEIANQAYEAVPDDPVIEEVRNRLLSRVPQ